MYYYIFRNTNLGALLMFVLKWHLLHKLLGQEYTGKSRTFFAYIGKNQDNHVTFDLPDNSPDLQAFDDNVNSARCAC